MKFMIKKLIINFLNKLSELPQNIKELQQDWWTDLGTVIIFSRGFCRKHFGGKSKGQSKQFRTVSELISYF